ncbi:MAG: CHAT domain-containing protein [Methylococcaceae bacterium]|nr:MAG: CHAT domain-containing protein [Methylococcaceae bacterium]
MRRLFLALFIGYICCRAQAGLSDFEELIRRGETQLQQGRLHQALSTLQAARSLAATDVQLARGAGLLGLIHYQMRHYRQAESLLQYAVDTDATTQPEHTRWLAALAALQAGRGNSGAAIHLYETARQQAAGEVGLQTGIRLGLAALLPPESRLAELQDIKATVNTIIDDHERAHYLLNLAEQARAMGPVGLQLAYASFEQARQNGNKLPRLSAETLGGLAQLYEDQQRLDEAWQLNQQAIQTARRIDAHDLLLELEWRQGRLHRARKNTPEAVAAYQRAVDHIEAIRQDIPVEFHEGRSSFRATLEPVYLGLADLLLQQASHQPDGVNTALLRRARTTVELLKQSEMEDFLGGRCAVQNNINTLLETIEPGTAVLYPIILPDRLELLVSSGEEMRQYTQAVDAATLQNLARKMVRDLRMGKSNFTVIAQQLYRWLIAPAEPWLRGQRTQTLVVVPDGVLRLIPFAALHDGEHYLIEQYALAISAGLTLLEAAPLQQRGIKTLLAGMSEPGPVLERLPAAYLRGMTVDEARRRKLKQQLSLPGVAQELDSLRSSMPNTLLMNESFTVDGFKRQVIQEPYSVVHIASHGVFGKTADSSFLMAYDGVIDIDELERLLKSDKFARQPVELLTLSACQTAEGDDRAPLGLSGVALKAKVRSALGTLWPVSDEAAARLMTEFYQRLTQPGTSKVKALQQAQIALLKSLSATTAASGNMEHPYYWSPFILVGNWR